MKEETMYEAYNILADIQVNEFEDLKGAILCKAETKDDEELLLYITDKYYVRFYHEQDCCESVYIEDIEGDLQDLVGSPILMAEEVTRQGPEDDDDDNWVESYTWTFYKFATLKGSVTVRFYGSSNGYYSESVYMEVVDNRS